MVADLTDRNTGLIVRLGRIARRAGRAVAPGRRAWRGAAWGALIALTVVLLVMAYGLFGQTDPAWFLIGTPLFLIAFALAGGLLTLLWRILKSIPTPYVWVLATAVLVLAYLALTALSVPVGIFAVGLGILAMASLVGAGITALMRGGCVARNHQGGSGPTFGMGQGIRLSRVVCVSMYLRASAYVMHSATVLLSLLRHTRHIGKFLSML